MNLRPFAMLLPAILACALMGCAFKGEDGGLAYSSDGGNAVQPYPTDYRSQLLAFLKTYLNDPTNIHNATLAEPVQRTVGGRQRYVTCVRFSMHESDGSYNLAKERAVIYIDGRLDRIMEQPGDLCAGATYMQFPELEKMSR